MTTREHSSLQQSGSLSRGVRFAPSPTGRFHLGNLRTAWISWACARLLEEPWVVRFEDIDRPRVLAGARESQLEDLAALGMVPDELHTQSERIQRHWEVFLRGVREGLVYPCTCSRKTVQEALQGMASAPHGEPAIYNGKCRNARERAPLRRDDAPTIAWRFRAADPSGAQDIIIARTERAPEAHSGPESAGFAPAYHWACAIDDWDGGYRLLVRAWDLESATPHQRAIQSWLRASEGGDRATVALSAVYHTALVTTDQGGRLEKRTRGVTWPELQAEGMSMEKLLSAFRESWAGGRSLAELRDWMDRVVAAPEGVGGEASRTLSLSRIGIHCAR